MSLHYTDKQVPEISEDILLTAKGIVYTITNTLNNKVYVGQTLTHNYIQRDGWKFTGIKDRWRRHISDAKSKYKESLFYKDILEKGEEIFEAKIYKIIPINEIHTLNIEEFNAINELNSLEPNGYNKDKWKNSMSFSKYIFMNHFKLLDDIPSLNKNTKSKDRATQICVSQANIINLSKKDIEEIYIKVINSGGNPDQIRLITKIREQKDLYRTTWYIGKNDPSKLIKYIISLAEALKENPFIEPKVKSILETNNLGVDVYKYQNRLDEASKFIFKSISGMITHYKNRGFSSYLLVLNGEGTRNIRYNFGGKTIEIKDAYNQAVEFVEKLKQMTTIKSIKLKELQSCPQQQATIKVANITFIDE